MLQGKFSVSHRSLSEWRKHMLTLGIVWLNVFLKSKTLTQNLNCAADIYLAEHMYFQEWILVQQVNILIKYMIN